MSGTALAGAGLHMSGTASADSGLHMSDTALAGAELAVGWPPNAATFRRPLPGQAAVAGPGPTTATTSGRRRAGRRPRRRTRRAARGDRVGAGQLADQQRRPGAEGGGSDQLRPARGRCGPAAARPGWPRPCGAPGGSRRTWCTRNTRAPSQAQIAVVASVPVSRPAGGWSSVSPTKSLLDSDTSTGQPVAGHLAEPPGHLQRLPGVLAEVVRRVDHDPVRVHPGRHRPRRPGPACGPGRRPSRRRRPPGTAGSAAPAGRRARRPARRRTRRPPRAAPDPGRPRCRSAGRRLPGRPPGPPRAARCPR